MESEAIDFLIQKNPKLKSARHALERMKPGAYVLHRSFGLGKIQAYDSSDQKLVIDFEGGKDGHRMDPSFCVGKVEILDASNLLVRQHEEPEAVNELIKDKAVDLVIEVLSANPNGEASVIEVENFLERLLGKTRFKKWWTQTKKQLVKDPRVAVPVKKGEPYILRDEPLSPEQEILEEFYANKQPKKKILLAEKLYQLSDSVEEVAEDLPQILEDLTTVIKNTRQLNLAERLHGVWVRNDLARHLCEDAESLEPTSTSLVESSDDLSLLAEELPNSYYKRFLDLLSRIYPEDWGTKVIELLKHSNGKFTSECIAFLIEREHSDLIEDSFKQWLLEQSFRGPVLYWIVKNRNTRRFQRFVKDILGHRLFAAILFAIDSEALQISTQRKVLLADFLSDDAEIVADLLQDASLEIARDIATSLIQNQGFDELTKKSILARFIKLYPEIQSILSTGASASEAKETQGLIVSQESLNLRKEEYEELVNVKIPENKEAIAIAKEHGDLKENSEYKMARQDQDFFLSRKAQLETELAKAQVTDFTDASADTVSIGSVVSLKQGSSSNIVEYSILGAWDSNPENNILSYQTPLAQQLLSKKVGESAETNIDNHTETWTIEKIDRWVDRVAIKS